MPQLQDPKQELIAQALANGSTQTDAYCAAYPTSTKAAAAVSATRMLNDPNKRLVIETRVAEILREREDARREAIMIAARETGIDQAWVMERLRENVARAMQAEPVMDSRGVPTGEYTYQGNVANKALELIGKQIGMFVERRETKVTDERRNESDILADLEREGIRVAVGAGRSAASAEATGKPH